MNARPSEEEAPSTRHSTRSRYSIPNYDHGNKHLPVPLARSNSSASASKSTAKAKSGINGRSFDQDEEDDLSRSSNKVTPTVAKTSQELIDLERDIALARTGSTSSRSSRDRPWRSPTNSGDALDSDKPDLSYMTNEKRWAPDENYVTQAREATSNAVVEMATKFADKEAERSDDCSFAPATNNEHADKDYVRERLSTRLVAKPKIQTLEEETEHDRVRNQAMKMLRIADSLDSNSPTSRSNSNESVGSNGASAGNKVTALFRTASGGMSMRQLQDHEVSFLKKSKNQPSQIERYSYGTEVPHYNEGEEVPRVESLKSNDEDDLPYSQHSANDEYGDDTKSKSSCSWSSRYSVERQLMALTGGLDSTRILNKMDTLHTSREKTKSARGMYRSSVAAMDGSGMDYDYSKDSNYDNEGGGVWSYIKGTLWSDLMEVNYDGTTQSLVRREKRRVKRRRLLMGFVGLMALCVVVGVLVVKGNPRNASYALSSEGGGEETVTFYVLADEPYDLSNARQLTKELEKLPKDAEFLIHLGNANGDSQSRCQEYGYERAASILKESPVPTFVIPGDRDWVNCNKPRRALEWWTQNLGMFDKKFQEAEKLRVVHQDGRQENFAFMYKGVLFISVHIVDTETDATEWTTRHERNVMWTKEQLNRDGYRSVVIFGHAPPSSKQGEYFWPIIDQIKDTNIPVLYLHANTEGGEYQEYHPFGEAQNFVAVQLEKKGLEAPMGVTVWGDEKRRNDMFEFIRRGHGYTVLDDESESK